MSTALLLSRCSGSYSWARWLLIHAGRGLGGGINGGATVLGYQVQARGKYVSLQSMGTRKTNTQLGLFVLCLRGGWKGWCLVVKLC